MSSRSASALGVALLLCSVAPAFAQPSFIEAYERGRAARAQRDAEAAARERDLAERADRQMRAYAEAAAAERRVQVGKAVANGQCAEARQVALAAGDFDLAERAQQLCVQAPAAPPN